MSNAISMRGIRHSSTTTRSNEVLASGQDAEHVGRCDGVLAEADRHAPR